MFSPSTRESYPLAGPLASSWGPFFHFSFYFRFHFFVSNGLPRRLRGLCWKSFKATAQAIQLRLFPWSSALVLPSGQLQAIEPPARVRGSGISENEIAAAVKRVRHQPRPVALRQRDIRRGQHATDAVRPTRNGRTPSSGWPRIGFGAGRSFLDHPLSVAARIRAAPRLRSRGRFVTLGRSCHRCRVGSSVTNSVGTTCFGQWGLRPAQQASNTGRTPHGNLQTGNSPRRHADRWPSSQSGHSLAPLSRSLPTRRRARSFGYHLSP